MDKCCNEHEDTERWETREFYMYDSVCVTCTGCNSDLYSWIELGCSFEKTHNKCTRCLFSDLKNEGFEECPATEYLFDYAIFHRERIYTSKSKNARKTKIKSFVPYF